MAKRSSQIEEERRSVMATPSSSTPRFLDWTQEDQPAEKTPDGENVELPTFPTPPTPLADTENKMADRPTLFTDKSPSPLETWKTFRFHKQHTTPPQEPPKSEKKTNKRAIQEIIVSQPIPYWYEHLHAMGEMLGGDVPASTLNKGCQTKFTPATVQEFEVLWDYLTKNDINIVWPPHTRLRLGEGALHFADTTNDTDDAGTGAKGFGKNDARRIADTHDDPAITGEGDTRRHAAATASTLSAT
ncbi:hypothetical protein ACJJTC_007368 [Scirpophaga incertulas]